MNRELRRYLESRSALVNRELGWLLSAPGRAPIPFLKPQPKVLRQAMRYSLMAGGKRLRPILVLAATECCGETPRKSLKTACALEMIHTYSLIHDDLPAMDDDDLRRGMPTNHKVFGEAVAILAGDGLLTRAFEVIAENAADARLPARQGYELVRTVAAAAGGRGMVGGQAADLEAEGFDPKRLLNGDREKALRLLDYIHTHKTAALITSALEAGAILAGAAPAQRRALRAYGRAIGLAFQITDDVLDVAGEKTLLGKRGSDEANLKLTFARLHGLDRSRALARRWIARARQALKPFGPKAATLKLLADYIIERNK